MTTEMSSRSARQKFFISYAHGDPASVRLLRYLADELAKSEHDVFTDQSIEGSQQWEDELTRHATACDSFVILISDAAFASDWVRAEAKFVYERFKVEQKPRVFVIRLCDRKFIGNWSVYLGDHQHLPCTSHAAFSTVRDAILGILTTAEAAARIRDAAARRKRRRMIVVSLAVALLLAAVIAYEFVLSPLANIRKLRSATATIGLPGTPVISLSEAKHARDAARGFIWSSRADAAYAQFFKRWSEAHLANARTLMKQGEVPKAFVLAALVAHENGGKLDDSFSRDYKAGHYASLKQTLRTGSALSAGLAVSVDGMQIAAGNALWNRDAGKRCSFQDAINAVAFGPLGLYTGEDEEYVRRSGCGRGNHFTVMAVRDQHRVLDDDLEDRVQNLAVSQDDTVAIVVAKGSSVRLQKGGTQFAAPLKHDAPVRFVAFSDDGSFLVTTSGETLNVWNRNGWNRPSPAPLKIDAKLPLLGAALNGDYVAVNALQSVKIWRLRPNVRFLREVALPWQIRSVALSRDVSDKAILLAMVSREGVFTDLVDRNATPDSADDALSAIGAPQAAATDVIFYDRNRELIVKRSDAVEIWDAYTSLEEGRPEDRLERWMNKFALSVDENGRFEDRLWPLGN